MNEFQKQWIASTCARESISPIKIGDKFYLDLITNEDGSLKVTVLSDDNNVIAIGKSCQELLNSPSYSFKEALIECARLLNIDCLTI